MPSDPGTHSITIVFTFGQHFSAASKAPGVLSSSPPLMYSRSPSPRNDADVQPAMVDCGAAPGQFTLWASLKGPRRTARAVAIAALLVFSIRSWVCEVRGLFHRCSRNNKKAKKAVSRLSAACKTGLLAQTIIAG